MEDSGDLGAIRDATTARHQSTFDSKGSFLVNEPVGSATISPAGRDVALASRLGLHIIDLDNPYSPPRYLPHRTPWEVADVQWSPFASRDFWIASTSNQKALIWNVAAPAASAVEHVLDAHTRALTDINFSAHEPDLVATCAVDSFVHCWDLRTPSRPVISFADWYAGATQVKWNRQDGHILASSHDEKFHIWDTRKGSHPLKTIKAHATKIYGIDWNRVEATNLLTCSLDRTIKIWDYEAAEEDRLLRTIHTPFPVWRARHTPFGYGVLVMPQRGNNELHLYDRRLEDGQPQDAPAEPVHSFEGHQDQVKEFLWRVRHGEDNGKDNRSFQLVSWGADKQLRLHPMSEEVLDSIGYRQGQDLHKQQRFSRKGAGYRTFHDRDRVTSVKVAPIAPTPIALTPDGPRRGSAISEALHPSFHKTAIPSHITSAASDDKGMRIRSGEKKHVNPISWMAGVKFSTRDDTSSPRDSSSLLTASQVVPWDAPESLGEEIASAGGRYKKVSFDEVDVAARRIVLSLNGPWGADTVSVYIKMTIRFPVGYPEEDVPSIVVEKTSSISDVSYTKMGIELKKLCDEYQREKQGTLEAILRYALGDQDLEQSLSWLRKMHNIANDTFDVETAGDSSSDEEDNIIGHIASIKARNLGLSAADLIKNNANVPLPKHCAALFAPSGKLVCFFPSKEPTASLLDSEYVTSRDRQHNELFEGFGSLQHMRRKDAGDREATDDNGSNSSEQSYSSSSSSSFNSAEGPAGDFDPFSAFSLWAGGAVPKAPRSATRSLQRSQQLSAMSYNKQPSSTKVKMHISIHSNADLDTSYPKLSLAADYMIFGKAEVVCSHNAWAARNNGYDDLADVWDLARLILRDEVPLEITQDLLGKENILVVARRSIVHIKRRDSGLGFGFDDPPAVREPKLRSHIKWGQHPLGPDYLIKALFDHFEHLGDVQMLAMLSCVFHEPAPIPSLNHCLAFWPPNQLPDVLNIPAFSPEYWPSSKIGRSFIEAPRLTVVSRPTSRATPEVISSYNSTINSGSYASSITPIPTVFEHDEESSTSQPRPIGLQREYSHGSSTKTRSFGTSPEHVLRRSSSIVGSAFNKVAHMLSNSPPLQRKEAVAGVELSTSAPSSAIPIMRARIKAEATSVRFSDPQSQARSASTVTYDDNDHDTIADDDDEGGGQKLRVRLLNQHLFDDEACYSGPLTPPYQAGKHNLWRDEYASHLDAWNLRQQHIELLSFNHIPSRFLTAEPVHPADELSQRPPIRSAKELYDGPTIMLRCSNCQHALPANTVSTGRNLSRRTACDKCGNTRSRVFCGICYEPIAGIYKTCLGCGHTAHSRCFEQWAKVSRGVCGECLCLCEEQTVVEKGDWIVIEDTSEERDVVTPTRNKADEMRKDRKLEPVIPVIKVASRRNSDAIERKSFVRYSSWRDLKNTGGT